MKKQMIFLALAALLVILISSTVSATPFNNTTNNRTNFTSTDIQPVIDHVNTTANHTIIIRQGNYTGVILNRSLTLQWDGIGTRPVIPWINITPAGSGSRLIGLHIRNILNLTDIAGINLNASNVIIEDSIIEGFSIGIILLNASNNLISRNNITGNMHGIGSWDSSNNTISGNNITGSRYGIGLLRNSSNNTISRNNITGNDRDGIWLFWNTHNITISRNNITGNGRKGIWLITSSNNTIRRNSITGNLVNEIALVGFHTGNRINFNRIIPASGRLAINNTDPGLVNATFNWFGRNENVTALISGNVTYNPWLILNISTTLDEIFTGSTSTVTACLRRDSNGTLHNTTFLMDTIPVTFNATPGSVSPFTATTINSIATSTFTGLTAGTANVSATVDNQTVSTSILIRAAPVVLPVYRLVTYTYTIRVPVTRWVRRWFRVRPQWMVIRGRRIRIRWRSRWVRVRRYTNEQRTGTRWERI